MHCPSRALGKEESADYVLPLETAVRGNEHSGAAGRARGRGWSSQHQRWACSSLAFGVKEGVGNAGAMRREIAVS